jgi:autotransporter-associated beta strand protein
MNATRITVCSFLFCALLPAAGSAADKTWTGAGGDGLWSTAANWSGGVPAAGDVAVFNAVGGAVSVGASATLQRVRVLGSSAVTLAIADGATLTFSNAGGGGLDAAGADLTIDGPGLLTFSTAGGENHLDNGANAGRALVLNAKITGATGFEAWRDAAAIPGGTIVMGNPGNDFTLNFNANGGHTIVASKLANAGQPSSLGAGSSIYFTYYGTLRYTGAGDSTGRVLLLNGGSAAAGIGGRVEHAGSGPLTLAGPVRNNANAAQTLVLLGDSASEARITGPIYNNTGTLAVLKEGSGTWVLAGSNTFSGGLTVNAGTLGLDSTNAFGAVSQIALNGGTLAVNPSAADGFAVSLPVLAVANEAALTVAQAATASTITLGGISAAGSLAVTAPGAGTAANRIFVVGLPSGVVGPWLTLNGGPAAYDPVTGLAPAVVTQQSLATKGSTLPDGEGIEAIIDAVGTGADIALPADPTRLYSLTQTVSDDAATVDTAGKTLYAGEIAVAAVAAALTVGAQPQDGALLPPVAHFAAPVIPDNSAVAALNPLIWYDPSEAASVRVFAGSVTGLVNKGTGGAALNAAVVRSNFLAPFYAAGAESHAALPMLKFAVDAQGLQSLANCGVSGNAPRTIVAVMSRDAGKECIVSIGAGSTRNAFEPYLRNDYTRFGTYSNDIDLPVKPALTPVVLSMLNGVDGVLDAFQGFADGTASTVKNGGVLSTTATPLHLGHRNGGSSANYRGQIGEVLFFDRSLTSVERETVEAYLMAKWQQPKLGGGGTQSTATLTLRNESAAPLTVNAAVVEPLGNTVGLLKAGAGGVALAGGVTLYGPVLVEGGTLTVDTPAGANDTLGGAISGAGALVKGGGGLLRLPYSVVNGYAGGTAVTGGTLRIGNSAALGTGAVTVADGGTLDIGDNPVQNTLVITNRITVAGAGADGVGAIVNNGVSQMNAIQNTVVTLAGDAAFGGSGARWDFRSKATLDLDGHTFTKAGRADLRFSGGVISNAPVGTAVSLQQGTLGLEGANVFAPNDSQRVMAIASGARFGLYGATVPFNWSIVPADGAVLWVYGTDTATNKNVFTSDIALDGTLHLTADGSYGKNLTGLLSGTGGLSVSNGGALAVSLLSHPANTFAGLVTVSNAVLGLRHPGSLPDVAKLTVKNAGGVRVYPYGTGWTDADVEALAGSGAFASNSRLQFDVAAGETAALGCDIGAPFLGMLDKLGAGELALDGDVTLANHARTYAGTLTLTNAATFSLGNYGLYLADGTSADTALIVGGDAQLTTTDRGAGVGTTGFNIGTHGTAGRSLVEIKDNAFVQGKFRIGGNDLADTNCVGAVYQSGWSRVVYPAGSGNDGMVGLYGYGLYQLDGGELVINGGTQFGVMRNSPKSVGIFRQTGGLFTFTQGYGGTFAFSRGGIGVAQFEGGTARIQGQLELLDDYNNNGETGNNLAGGTAVATVAGTADVTTGAEVLFANRTNGAQSATAILNLTGGKLTTTYLRRLSKIANCAVNFNGGTLCVTNNAGNTRLISADNAAIQLAAFVYAGGAVIDLGAGVTRTVDVPLAHPAGSGVLSIPVTAGGSGYVAPPYVSITGGGGSNATAFARIDRATGALTAVEVTNPGAGYTNAPAVALIGGGGSGATLGAAQLKLNADGGLTKTGPGTLILNVPSTYRGATVAAGGILRLAHPQAVLPGTDFVIGDGTLDLGGHTVTARSVRVTGAGAIANGRVVTASAVKTGPGTAAWDADVELAVVTVPTIPGLLEGRLSGAFNKTDSNPGTAVELSTLAANGPSQSTDTGPKFINGKEWIGNSTYVYTGYIWNRAATNVTWTFGKCFDDSVLVRIDGAAVIDHSGWNTPLKANVTLTPGPHAFEARFGQGTGGVGGTTGATGNPDTEWWNVGGLGLGVDWQGRNAAVRANYVALVDPGDGSLFTVNLPETAPDGVVRVVEGTLQLPPRQPGWWQGTIDLGGAPAGNRNLVLPNPKTAVVLATDQANSKTRLDSGPRWSVGQAWPTNLTECYSGYIWNRSSVTTNLTLYKNFDDTIDLYLDGALVPVTGGNSWNKIGLMDVSLTPGPHSVEIRFGQGAGGAGPSDNDDAATGGNTKGWPQDIALGVDWQHRGEMVKENFVKLQDPGDGSLLTLTPYSGDADALSGVTVEVSGGAAFDLGGLPRDGVTVTGEGAVLNSAGGAGNVLSPAGDGRTGSMSLSGGSLAGATYRLTIRDAATNAPGLWEGMINAAWDIATSNPKTAVQLTTRAGNGEKALNGTYAGGLWAGNYHTWVYTGTLWVDSPTNVTWTWRFTFDDDVALWLDGELVANINLNAGIQYRNVVMTPGPHAIEVRYGDGTGNVGPASGLGGLTYDPLGRGSTSALENFVLLADSGDGTVLSLTADDGVNDVITSSGALDLTGLAVVPSDALSAEPLGREYVILRAEGGLTGTATVSGFTNKKWKLRKSGNELLLTTQGGSVMLLK